MKNQIFNDVDGNELIPGDKVVCLDIEDLEGANLRRGDVLVVTRLIDLGPNYIGFKGGHEEYAFYGHRVLKLSL